MNIQVKNLATGYQAITRFYVPPIVFVVAEKKKYIPHLSLPWNL